MKKSVRHALTQNEKCLQLHSTAQHSTALTSFLSFLGKLRQFLPKAQFYVAFILVFALIVCSGIPAFAATASVEYVERSIDANGNVISTTKTAENCTWIRAGIVEELEDSKWYYADSRLAIPRLTVSGNAHLILTKGSKLQVKNGIYLTKGSSLTIYGQPDGDGTLIATGNKRYRAGIGGSEETTGGMSGSITITIHGGNIEATGGDFAAGIGGTRYDDTIIVNIYGGSITAKGGINGAGIGAGSSISGIGSSASILSPHTTINIYGGNITATGGKYAPSNPGGNFDLSIRDNYKFAAGIGGGVPTPDDFSTINILGGNITANSYTNSTGYGIRGNINLSYRNAGNSIYATNYKGDIRVADGKTFITDTGQEIKGKVSVSVIKNEQKQQVTYSEIDGRTLTPKSSHKIIIDTPAITASAAKAFTGDTVTLSPAKGYENLTGLNVNGAAITGNTFIMPENDVTVTGTATPITYTITYNLDGGTVSTANPATYTVESDTFTLNNPTKSGYYFVGWSAFEGGVKVMTRTIPKGSTGDRTYIANWEQGLVALGWTESYNADGTADRPYLISDSYGWDFLVNELKTSNYSKYSGKIFKLTNDITVTSMLGTNGGEFAGTFDGNGKTLTFDYEDATALLFAPFKYVKGATIKDLTVDGTIKSSREDGNKYIGGLIERVNEGGETKIENCKFVGKLLAKDNANAYGGGFVAHNSGTLTINGCLYAPAELEEGETEPSKEGTATFARDSSYGTSTITNSYYTRTLGAVQGEQIYTVTADDEIKIELAGNSENVLTYDETIYARENDVVSLTISGGNTREGYAFRGYRASVGTLTESGGKYSLTMPAENVIVEAELTPIEYAITYSGVDGADFTAANPTRYTIESEDFTLNNPTKAGYTFTGWTGSNGETPQTSVTIPAGSTGEKTFTANFSANTYVVNFNANNGAGEMDSQSYAYDSDAAALTANAFTREGYTFTGWNTEADGSGSSYTDGQEVTNLAAEGEITLYAQWEIITYTITYNLDNGTAENPTSYTIESEDFTLTNPTKDGFTFAGWTGTGLDGATMSVTIAKGSTGARAYTATWTGGGSEPEPDPNVPTFNEKHSVILEGEIGLKFYVYLPAIEGVDYASSYMEFDISGDKSNELKYYKAEDNRNIDGDTYHYFTCYMSSVQMADKITATFHYGDNITVSQEYLLKRYLDNILEGSFSEEAKNLMLAIQDYGHFAQQMLSKANGWTIGKDYADMPASFNEASYNDAEIEEARDGVKDYAIVRDTGDSEIEKVEFSLLFDSKTTINVYLTAKSTYNGTVSAMLNGKESATKLSDGRYLVQIRNIPAHELAKMYEIDVTAGSSFTVKVAALSYVDTMINKTDSTIGGVDLQTMKNAVTAFYFYYEKAIAYQDSLNQ